MRSITSEPSPIEPADKRPSVRPPRPDITFAGAPEQNIHRFPGNTLEVGRNLLAAKASPTSPSAKPMAVLLTSRAEPEALVARPSARTRSAFVTVRTKRSSIMRLRFALATLVARVDDDMFRWLCDRSRVRAELRAAALVIAAVTSTLLAYVAIA